jgi:hypothetical protein
MKASRLAVIGLAVAGVAALLWVVGGNAFARHREKQAEKAWVQSFGTLQDLLSRYPKTATNETARRLEDLAKPLGLDLTPRTQDSIAAEARSTVKSRESEAPWFPQDAFLYLTA